MAEKKWGVKSFNLCSLPHLVITSDASQSCVPLVLAIYPTKSLGFFYALLSEVSHHIMGHTYVQVDAVILVEVVTVDYTDHMMCCGHLVLIMVRDFLCDNRGGNVQVVLVFLLGIQGPHRILTPFSYNPLVFRPWFTLGLSSRKSLMIPPSQRHCCLHRQILFL